MPAAANNDIATLIRNGNSKRREEERKKQRLEEEYLREMQHQQSVKRSSRKPTDYLPIILTFLLFISFPLSDQVVDWYLVGMFSVANLALAFLLSQPSDWMSIAFAVLMNFTMVRLSSEIYELPTQLLHVPPAVLARYVGANAVAAGLIYFFYVDQRVWKQPGRRQSSLSDSRQSFRIRQSAEKATAGALEAFAQKQEWLKRLEILMVVLFIGNYAALMYLNVLPGNRIWSNALAILRMI